MFTLEQIKRRMDTVQSNIDSLSEQIALLQRHADEGDSLSSEILEHHQRLLSWADMYDSAPPEEKKMVVSYIFKAVSLSRGYHIQIEFNISEAQYLSGMEMA